jgi:hypothetical protein
MDTHELGEARFHLSEFDTIPEDPKGIYHLSLGTSLLMDIIEGNFHEDQKVVAKKIMFAYLKKVNSKMEEIIKTLILLTFQPSAIGVKYPITLMISFS